MRKIKVLVVDDNETFLRSATLVLGSLRRVLVLDAVGSGVDALNSAQKLAPDMVLLDFNMPQMNGIETAWRLRAMGYAGKIVLMSFLDEQEIRDRRPNIAADAFIDKQHFIEGIFTLTDRFFPCAPATDGCA